LFIGSEATNAGNFLGHFAVIPAMPSLAIRASSGAKIGASHSSGRGQRKGQDLLHVGEFLVEHPHPRLDCPRACAVAHALEDA